MSTQKSTSVASGVALLVVMCAAILWRGCKDDDRPPLTPDPPPTPAAAPSATGSAAEDPETAMRKYELSSSALALQAKAREASEGDLARACTALDAASRKDCEAVKRAGADLKRAKDGLMSEVRLMLGDPIARTERAVEALCP